MAETFSCSVKLQHVYVLTNETGEKPSCLQSFAVYICHSWWRRFESFQNHHGISSMAPVPPRSLLKCVAHSSDYTTQTERSSDCHHCHAAALCSVIFSPHISELKIPLTKPYKKSAPQEAADCGIPKHARCCVWKAGLCRNRAVLFKRQPRGVNSLNAWQSLTFCGS